MIKKLILALSLLLLPVIASAEVPHSFAEEDGSPEVYFPYQVKVPDGSLTDNEDGTVSLDYLSTGTATSTYLKLDTSNDPFTGTLGGSNIDITGTLDVDDDTQLGNSGADQHGINVAPNTSGSAMLETLLSEDDGDVNNQQYYDVFNATGGVEEGHGNRSLDYKQRFVDFNLSGNIKPEAGEELTLDAWGFHYDIDATNEMDDAAGDEAELDIIGGQIDVNWGGTLTNGNVTLKGLDVNIGGEVSALPNAAGDFASTVTGASRSVGIKGHATGASALNIGGEFTATGATTNVAVYVIDGDIIIDNDTDIIGFGLTGPATPDATIGFDGDSLNIIANAVTGTDTLEMTAEDFIFTGTLFKSTNGTFNFDNDNLTTTGTLTTNDHDILDDTPHLRFWDTDNNITYEWHLDPEDNPWQNFGLWRGVSGAVSPNTPLIYFDNDNDIHIIGGDDTLTITDDFVFGSPQLADDGDTGHDSRFWFDKSKGAFRAGKVTGDAWDDVNVGNRSFAIGHNTEASGGYSTAIGAYSKAAGTTATAIGYSAVASGMVGTAIGDTVTAGGIYSVAISYSTTSSGTGSVGIGHNVTASGNYSTALGRDTSSSGNSSFASGYSSSAGFAPRSFTIVAGGTTVTISGDVTAEFSNGDSVRIQPANRIASVSKTISNVTYGAPNTTFTINSQIDGTSTLGKVSSNNKGEYATVMGYDVHATNDYGIGLGKDFTNNTADSFMVGFNAIPTLNVSGSEIWVGADDTGYDVKFYGSTSGSYMLWDESEDDLVIVGGDIDIRDDTPHLRFIPDVGDSIEFYNYDDEFYCVNVTDETPIWKIGADNHIFLFDRNLTSTGNITTTGLGTFGNLDVDTLNLNDNIITDSTGTISFGNEDLTTTGNVGIGAAANANYELRIYNLAVDASAANKYGEYMTFTGTGTGGSSYLAGLYFLIQASHTAGTQYANIGIWGNVRQASARPLTYAFGNNITIDTAGSGALGTIGNAYGYSAGIKFVGSATGTMGNVIGFYSSIDAEDGIMTTIKGVSIPVFRKDAGSIGTGYGVFLEEQVNASNNYELWIDAGGEVFFRDSALHIGSLNDGFLDYTADTAHRFLNHLKLTGDNRQLTQGTGDDVNQLFDGSDWIFDISGATADAGEPDFVFKLNDDAGASVFYIFDSGDVSQAWINSDGAASFNGAVTATGGIATKYSETDVADPPTDAQLDTVFGTPAALGGGYIGIIDDNDADTDVWICFTSDANWYYIQGSQAN